MTEAAGRFGEHGERFVVQQKVEGLVRNGIDVVHRGHEAEQVAGLEIHQGMAFPRGGNDRERHGSLKQVEHPVDHEFRTARNGDFPAEAHEEVPACFHVGKRRPFSAVRQRTERVVAGKRRQGHGEALHDAVSFPQKAGERNVSFSGFHCGDILSIGRLFLHFPAARREHRGSAKKGGLFSKAARVPENVNYLSSQASMPRLSGSCPGWNTGSATPAFFCAE